MSLLAPLWLLLAGAAAVPLLVHLLRRRIGAHVEFPAARYLARAEREHSRRLKLRNLLLMALRVLIVLLFAVAAARPVARLAGAGHAPTAMAIVLDNSMSSGQVIAGKPMLDRLRDGAREVLRRASATDRVWLLTVDGRVTGGTPSSLLPTLDAVAPFGGGGDPSAALRRAESLVRSANLAGSAVALATDAQITSWPNGATANAPMAVLVPEDSAAANSAVIAARALPTRWTPSGAVQGRIIADSNAVYRVTIAGAGGPRTLARGSVGGHRSAEGSELLVRATPPERGWLSGSIEIEPDELRADDRRYFALWVGAPPAVHVDAAIGPFTITAIDALRDAGRVQMGENIAVVPADRITRLPALIAAPAERLRIGAANRALAAAGVPWRFGIPRPAGRAQAVKGHEFDNRVDVAQRFALDAAPGAASDTLVLVNGEPWIVAGDGWVLVASPLTPDATSLPIRASFVPWIEAMLAQRLTTEGGSVVERAPGASLDDVGADQVESPAGDVIPRPATANSTPGVYFLRRGARRVGALVVNPEPEESDVRRWSPREFRGRVHGTRSTVVARPDQWADAVFSISARRPLAPALLLAALLLLALESWLVRSAFTRTSDRSTPGTTTSGSAPGTAPSAAIG